jgi:DNA uptake protein ComE-like DNA-binding protein
MTNKIRVNTANPQELLEIQGLDATQADAIVRFRSEHGPIKDAAQLSSILGNRPVESLSSQLDFSPSTDTAAEAPGA